MPDDIEHINSRRARWIRAMNEGSAEGFAAAVAEDAVWFPPRSEAIRGKEAIRTWLEKPFRELDYDYSVSNVRIRTAGEWAVETADFVSRVSAKGEQMPPHRGSYTMIWKKTTAGEWLIERYIDHSATFESVDS